ncbi:MAG: polysaccharide deacetylase [Phascolarctobacterium sp.]|nr:polysaccharide deacetylase [Phascolarctobacterium sp.]
MFTLKNGDGIAWPEDKRIAVMVTFDFDAELLRKSVIGKRTIGFSDTSRGQYGPDEGLVRCLAMLERQQLKTTFFIPGAIAEMYPEQVRAIIAAGHEIAYHGYEHDASVDMPREEEELNMAKSEELFAKLGVEKLSGYRGPLDLLPNCALDLMQERGYLYNSTLKDCDWAYCHENGIVELPTEPSLDDFSYFYFSYADEATITCTYPVDYVYDFWKDNFDELADEGDKVFVLKLHPQLIGRASRVRMLERFIEYMRKQGAWITTCQEVASYVKSFYENKGGAAQ